MKEITLIAIIGAIVWIAVEVVFVLLTWNLVFVAALGVNSIQWWQALLLLLFIRVANPTKVNKE